MAVLRETVSMSSNSVPYLIPLLLSAMLSFGLAFYAAHYFRVAGAIPFMVLTLLQSGWTTGMMLEIISPTLQEKQFWDSFQWGLIYIVTIAVFWFTQSILPVKRKAHIPYWLLAIFPTLFMLLLITNPLLVYPNESIVNGIPFNQHVFGFSLLDWVGFVYVYCVLGYCVIVLHIEQRRAVGQIRRKLRWALLGVSVQSSLYLVMFMAGISILGQRDTSPFTFLVGNVLMGWGLFRNDIFELGPIARSQVVENMSEAFIVTDEAAKIVDMNRVAHAFASPEWKGRTIMEAFPEWASEIKPEYFWTPYTHDFVRTIDGSVRSMELKITPLSDVKKNTVGYLMMVRDISARKALENALAASEARYRSIIDSMAEGVIIYDHNGTILTCNAASEKILGIRCEELHGHSTIAMGGKAIHEDGSPFLEESTPISIALKTHMEVRDVVMGIQKDAGSIKWLSINAQPFNFRDENMVETQQVIVSFRDVTELREMQAAATRATLAQEQSRLLAQFVQSASHEFRTPLAVIGTSVYLMSRQTDATRRQGHAEIAEREIKRIASLMDTLVNLVQLDSGIPLELYPTQIDSVVRASVGHFERTASDHHIHMQVTASPTLPTIPLDTNYFTMGIEQVLDNALRYTPDHGRVDVSVTVEGKQVVIKVQDTGLGINEEELAHIFDRFWRRDSAHHTPGFGLGLSIVQKVIQRHDGSIGVESAVGKGTLVVIKLPV